MQTTISTRNQSLDGIRGLAVLLVLLYHHAVLNMGWAGVDLFFVLSGYLITTILRRTRDDPGFWSEFWIKRFTRILPPLMILVLAAQFFIQRVSPLVGVAYLLSLGDILAYWRPVESMTLLWSLAVEEHFYIVWPFAVRYVPRKRLLWALGVLLLVEPLVRLVVAQLFHHQWTFIYYLTPFRLDGLACGAMLSLALGVPRGKEWISRWSGRGSVSTALAWMIARLVFGNGFTRKANSSIYNSLCYSLVAIIAAFGIAYVLSHPEARVSRILAWSPLTFTGSISYGLYLYQLLVKALMIRYAHLGGTRLLLCDTLATFVLAWVSFVFYERPLLQWGKKRAEELAQRRSMVVSKG
jgi:peptidoglycan/LPS O-acetylase OafA/YrhL